MGQKFPSPTAFHTRQALPESRSCHVVSRGYWQHATSVDIGSILYTTGARAVGANTCLDEPLHASHDQEWLLFTGKSQVVSHMDPHGVQLWQTVVSEGLPRWDHMIPELPLGVTLGKEGNAERSKVSPEQKVSGVKGDNTPIAMLQVVTPPVVSISWQLNPTVVQPTRFDLVFVLS